LYKSENVKKIENIIQAKDTVTSLVWIQRCVGIVIRCYWSSTFISYRFIISRLVGKSKFSDVKRMEPSIYENNTTRCVCQLFGITKSTAWCWSFSFFLHLGEKKKWIDNNTYCMYQISKLEYVFVIHHHNWCFTLELDWDFIHILFEWINSWGWSNHCWCLVERK
jgi:hypothetical protein